MQKQGFKIEMANVATLMQRAIEGKQIATKAKIARNELKAKAKETADLVDNFANGPYFEVVIEGKKLIDEATKLGLGDSPEVKALESARTALSALRNELGNGSDYTKMFK
jgi:hypothetical protein